jgi:ribosomal protein S30
MYTGTHTITPHMHEKIKPRKKNILGSNQRVSKEAEKPGADKGDVKGG